MNAAKNFTTIHLLELCNTLNDLSNKLYVPNKTEDLSLSVFSMITGINESKTLTKHIYHVNVNVNLIEKKCNSYQWWNNDICPCKRSCM